MLWAWKSINIHILCLLNWGLHALPLSYAPFPFLGKIGGLTETLTMECPHSKVWVSAEGLLVVPAQYSRQVLLKD